MFEKVEPPEIYKVAEAIVDECDKTGVDTLFIISMIEVESNFDVEAVSSAGARGLMQLLPGTFKEVSTAKRMFDPSENVRAGIRYVAKMYKIGFTKPESALLAYNQGPGTASSVYRGEQPMPREATAYIPKVMARYRELLVKDGKKAQDASKLFLVASR